MDISSECLTIDMNINTSALYRLASFLMGLGEGGVEGGDGVGRGCRLGFKVARDVS